MLRKLLSIAVIPMPQAVKRLVYRRFFGWEIADDVSIGLSWIDIEEVVLAPGVRIGHFNLIKGGRRFAIGRNSYMKNFNQFLGPGLNDHHFPTCTFEMGAESRIMSRHFFDLSGDIVIADDVNIGGRDSQLWSHSRFTRPDGYRDLAPKTLTIEEGVYTGARVTLVHCTIPKGAVVGAGAVVTRSFEIEKVGDVIAGNPATVITR
ncbi:MAG: hypothetical protein JHC95_21110 [Solirubrobacteraceae bacterium]|nr:hypothetical protein [Solirubrobacteraceae bacterium]